MSSAVSFVMRGTSGRIHRLVASNKECHWAVDNLRLLRKDPAHIARIKREFQNFFGPPKGIAPEGDYGIIVVDLQRNIIFDAWEGGGHIGKIHGASLYFEAMADENRGISTSFSTGSSSPTQAAGQGVAVFEQTDDDYSSVRLREFFDEGRVTQVSVRRNSTDIQSPTLSDVIALLERGISAVGPFHCVLDMQPFQVETFDVCKEEETRALMARIEELGFTLTRQELALWEEHIRERQEG